MRKTTLNAINAFNSCSNYGGGNTTVTTENGETKLYLFGNLIAIKKGEKVEITNAGWFTNTTKERLNAIKGVNINQVKKVWYLNGKKWDGKLTKILNQ